MLNVAASRRSVPVWIVTSLKNAGASCCSKRRSITASRRISSSAPSLERSSSIVRHARALPVTTIFVSVELGSTPRAASRAIFRRWTLSATQP